MVRPLPPRPGYPPPPGWRPPPPSVPPWTLPPYPGAAPPRRSNTGAIVATILIGALLVGAGVVGVASATQRRTPVADVGYDYPEDVPRDAGSAPSSRATRAPRTTVARPPVTTTPPRTTTRATPTTPAGPRPVLALGDNPLFVADLGAAAVTCGLSRWTTTPQGAAAFFTSAMVCLEGAWAPVLQRAGLPYNRPNLAVPAGSTVDSPCTGSAGRSFAAFYCPRNQTIYMPFGTLQTDQYGAHPGVYLALFAHEFGHHVQEMAGVWLAYWDARYDAGADTEAGLELSRRAELQAQCFSGMFLAGAYPRGSVDRNILNEARTTQDRGDHTPGEPRDHGTDAHTVAWWEQGAQKNRTVECNTWLATPAQVS
jgi:predicted metalloprotease